MQLLICSTRSCTKFNSRYQLRNTCSYFFGARHVVVYLLLFRPNQTPPFESKEGYHDHDGHGREDSPEDSSVSLKQSISAGGSATMFGHGSRDSSRDGQADGIADLGDLIEDTAGQRLFFSGIGVGDDDVRDRE